MHMLAVIAAVGMSSVSLGTPLVRGDRDIEVRWNENAIFFRAYDVETEEDIEEAGNEQREIVGETRNSVEKRYHWSSMFFRDYPETEEDAAEARNLS
ncbi:hypothetical protein C8J57DRAFT_172581 [Mycena rebaudengoi]|nr:hypothetical protein C8J57DRAFT_172581 [Mycena rebaudengoi]